MVKADRSRVPALLCLLVWAGFVALFCRAKLPVAADARAIGRQVSAGDARESMQSHGAVTTASFSRNPIGMEFARIPPGSFTMGSGTFEAYRAKDETRHRVRISQPYYLSIHEVTVGQFQQFVVETQYRTEAERRPGLVLHPVQQTGGGGFNSESTWRNPGFFQSDEHPVTCVSWNDAQAFCHWLSQRERRRYRLPTEAEWEYACRAGSSAPFSVSCIEADWPDANLSYCDLMLKDSEQQPRDGFLYTAPAGSFPPNVWGVHDMHGNVCEWCSDWYEADIPWLRPSCDPTGPAEGASRVVRGAGFRDYGPTARSANRAYQPPDYILPDQGFRVVCESAP